MPFPIRCVSAKCRHALKVPNQMAGKPGRCPLCNTKMLIPVPEVFHCEIQEEQIKKLDTSVMGKAFEFILSYTKEKRLLWSSVHIDILWDPGVQPIWADEHLRNWYAALRTSHSGALYWLTEDSTLLYLNMLATLDPDDPAPATHKKAWRVITETTSGLEATLRRLFEPEQPEQVQEAKEAEEIAAALSARLCGRMQRILKRQEMQNIFV